MREIIADSRAIASKELRQLVRDPVSLALSVLFPIILISMFIGIFGFHAPSYNIPMVIADLDDSTLSKELIDELSGSKVVCLIEVAPTEAKALGSVESGDAAVAVIIPKGFSNLVASGNGFIELAADKSKPTSASLARGEVDRAAQDLAQSSAQGHEVQISAIRVIDRPVSGRPPTREAILPGMLGMVIILASFDDAVNAISRERERGTFPRLALTQANVMSIYIGKTLTTVLLTLLRTSLMLIIFVLIGLTLRGNVLLIYVTTCLMAVFTLGIGLAFSSRIKSSAALTVLEIALTFPLLVLTGATMSPQTLASGGRAISMMLPWTYGNEALRRVIYLGLGWQAVSQDLLVLALASMILIPLASALVKRSI